MNEKDFTKLCISIHILTRRMTLIREIFTCLRDISIHILTRRMTHFCTSDTQFLPYFNSHPHKEDDAGHFVRIPVFCYFNSHPHKEDDAGHFVRIPVFCYFNSHPHKEDDAKTLKTIRKKNISIHILTRRMTANMHYSILLNSLKQ